MSSISLAIGISIVVSSRWGKGGRIGSGGIGGNGGRVTFQVPIGDAVEGEPGRDLSAHRLLLEAEVFLVGQDTPIVRHFTFPGCG